MYVAGKFKAECRKLAEKSVGRQIAIEKPPGEIGADLAVPCFSLGQKPAEIASEAAEKINKSLTEKSLILKAEASGPYLNFHANPGIYCAAALEEIMRMKSKYGSGKRKKKTVVVDFSSPNIAKPMNIGHLRSTIIGQSLCNIYRFLGFRVIGDNHPGDWGTQFGKLITAWKKWGSEKELKSKGIEHLASLYVRFHEEEKSTPELADEAREWFRKLEGGNKEATLLWKRFRALSFEAFFSAYKLLNIKFDSVLGESFYCKPGIKIIREFLKKGMAEKSEGAVIIDFSKHGIDGMIPLVIQKSDESTLYSTRDLATIKYRMKKFKPFKILYVIGSEQKLYLKQVFAAAKLLGYECDFMHVDFGMMMMSGEKMSTRKGRFVLLDDILKESVNRAEKTIMEKNPSLPNRKEVARQVGLGAVIFNDLKHDRVKNINFEWDKVLNFEGDSCPYLQYAIVRANSILEKVGKGGKQGILLRENEEIMLAKKLADFPFIVESAASQNKPNIIAQYLLELAAFFSNFYSNCKVIGSEHEKQRLSLVKASGMVIEIGLNLLNIETPEKM